MAYLSYPEYAAYGGEVSYEDFPALDKAAENLIDVATRFAAVNGLPTSVMVLFKKAICAQIDYFGVYGVDVAYTGQKPQGFRVGEVSVTNGSNTKGEYGFSALSPIALSILEQAGLMSRHAVVAPDLFAPYPLGVI
jgi:hypothetical protein